MSSTFCSAMNYNLGQFFQYDFLQFLNGDVPFCNLHSGAGAFLMAKLKLL